MVNTIVNINIVIVCPSPQKKTKKFKPFSWLTSPTTDQATNLRPHQQVDKLKFNGGCWTEVELRWLWKLEEWLSDCAIDAHWYINEPAMLVFCCTDCVPSFLRYASYHWEQWGKSALRFAFSVWYHASGAPFNHRGEWFRRSSLYASCKSQCESSPWSLGATSADDCYCRNHWYRPLPWYGSFIGTGRTIEHVVML